MTTRAPKISCGLFSVDPDVTKTLAVTALLKASVDPLGLLSRARSSQSEPEVLADVAFSTLSYYCCSVAELPEETGADFLFVGASEVAGFDGRKFGRACSDQNLEEFSIRS
jgi:hypothetical protein